MSNHVFTCNDELLAESIRGLEEATKNCTDEELNKLNRSGYIPNGVLNFLRACRGRIE